EVTGPDILLVEQHRGFASAARRIAACTMTVCTMTVRAVAAHIDLHRARQARDSMWNPMFVSIPHLSMPATARPPCRFNNTSGHQVASADGLFGHRDTLVAE